MTATPNPLRHAHCLTALEKMKWSSAPAPDLWNKMKGCNMECMADIRKVRNPIPVQY
jgi:hypothetical protein